MATWNAAYESNPSNAGTATSGYASIKDPKTEVRVRMQNEHDTYSRASSGADGSLIKSWVHIKGSARTYYTTTTPTSRPDGVTALSSNDLGRLLVNSTTNVMSFFKPYSFSVVRLRDKHGDKPLKVVTTSIGGWNIEGSGDKNVSLSGIVPDDVTVIRVGAIIRSDGANTFFRFPVNRGLPTFSDVTLHMAAYFTTPFVKLRFYPYATGSRTGTFSNAIINRGWITVWYYE